MDYATALVLSGPIAAGPVRPAGRAAGLALLVKPSGLGLLLSRAPGRAFSFTV
jgi:hypothetical protein